MSTADNYAGNPRSVAYDPAKGEVFVTCIGGVLQVISDSNNAVVAYVLTAGGDIGDAYDSGKGELFVATYNNVLSVLSDSASSSASASPTSSPSATSTTSASTTPTVPEFNSAALASVAVGMLVVALCVGAISRKKSTIRRK